MKQRELKFRALCEFDTKEGTKREMVYFGLPEMDNGLWSFPIDKSIRHINSYESPLMQYTGIRDSRGIDVYEGDIVNFGGNKHIVSYEENRKVSYGHGDCGETFFIGFYIGYSYGTDNKFFVLGNIYENPDLIK